MAEKYHPALNRNKYFISDYKDKLTIFSVNLPVNDIY